MLLYYSFAFGLSLLTTSDALSSSAPVAASAAPAAASGAAAGTWPVDLVGTWVSKARSTITGPDFYNPISDTMIEPDHPGISYSFTNDGHYEEAYYRAVANPADPSCPSGSMQWQHGSFVMNATGSLLLTPIAIDGRQLTSAPCDYDDSEYIRYEQKETFQRYSVYMDPYHNVQRLDLYQFNGAPMQPLYLMYQPPQMLPTTTLNPTSTATTAGGGATSKAKVKKRGGEATKPKVKRGDLPPHMKVGLADKRGASAAGQVVHHINADRLWWLGLGMLGFGGLLYLGPRRMGIQL